jgi:hypothetical protein
MLTHHLKASIALGSICYGQQPERQTLKEIQAQKLLSCNNATSQSGGATYMKTSLTAFQNEES